MTKKSKVRKVHLCPVNFRSSSALLDLQSLLTLKNGLKSCKLYYTFLKRRSCDIDPSGHCLLERKVLHKISFQAPFLKKKTWLLFNDWLSLYSSFYPRQGPWYIFLRFRFRKAFSKPLSSLFPVLFAFVLEKVNIFDWGWVACPQACMCSSELKLNL